MCRLSCTLCQVYIGQSCLNGVLEEMCFIDHSSIKVAINRSALPLICNEAKNTYSVSEQKIDAFYHMIICDTTLDSLRKRV